MLKNSISGLLAFGLTAAVAGYVWTAFEFPFAILIPAAVGWYAVSLSDFGGRTALWAALVGGVSFTVSFLVAIALSLTDGSPFGLAAWMSAAVAAALAGAATGWLFGGAKGSLAIAGFAAAGMLLATVFAGLMRDNAPAATDVPGLVQYTWFALGQGLIGGVTGAFIGAGVSWVAGHLPARSKRHHASAGGLTPSA